MRWPARVSRRDCLKHALQEKDRETLLKLLDRLDDLDAEKVQSLLDLISAKSGSPGSLSDLPS